MVTRPPIFLLLLICILFPLICCQIKTFDLGGHKQVEKYGQCGETTDVAIVKNFSTYQNALIEVVFIRVGPLVDRIVANNGSFTAISFSFTPPNATIRLIGCGLNIHRPIGDDFMPIIWPFVCRHLYNSDTVRLQVTTNIPQHGCIRYAAKNNNVTTTGYNMRKISSILFDITLECYFVMLMSCSFICLIYKCRRFLPTHLYEN